MASKKKKTNNKAKTNNQVKKVEVNYYQILNVEETATLEEMEKAYNKLLKKFKKEGLSDSSKKMKDLKQAYNNLIKPTKEENSKDSLEKIIEKEIKKEKEEVLIEVNIKEEPKSKEISIDKEELGKTLLNIAIIAVLIIGLFVISELGRDGKNDKKLPTPASSNPLMEEEIPESEMKELTDITYENFKELLAKEEASIVFIGRPTCGWCVYQLPVLKHVMYLYNLEVKYLNTDKMTQEENQHFVSLDEKWASSGYGTPMILVVQNNKITYKLEGAYTQDGIISFLVNNGLIKE